MVEEYPDSSPKSGKQIVVEFINPFGECLSEWRNKDEIIMSDISDEDAWYLKEAFKDAEQNFK